MSQIVPAKPTAMPPSWLRLIETPNKAIPMSNVQIGLSAFNIPAMALGRAVCADAKRMAGMKLPTDPMRLTQSHCSRFSFRQCLSVTGNNVKPAIAMRSAASSVGGNKEEPSDAKRPHFIRIKLLPQTKPSSNRTNMGAHFDLVDNRVVITSEIRLCWVSAVDDHCIFVA